jgi:hypothetical protein
MRSAATSKLTFDDVTANTMHANSVSGIAGAYGGAGGNSITGFRGAGAAATASLTLTGAFSVSATSNAVGGVGGKRAIGGKATSTSDAIGTTSVTSDATATGGSDSFGGAGAGTASATAIGEGSSGDAQSAAISGSSILTGSLVTAASANADAPVDGMSTAKTWAAIGNGAILAPALVADQAVAQITAEPATTDVNRIDKYNANIRSAFTTGKTPTYFGIGELGGAFSTGGSVSETETSSIHMTVDLIKAFPLHDLLIGFYGGSAAGAGFTGMSLDVKINGTDHINNFTTVAAANAFFKNNAVDYGALTGISLQLDISLSITE